MKKVLSTLLIIALSAIAFNVSAQVISGSGVKGDPIIQKVTLNSLHKYNFAANGANKIKWQITGDCNIYDAADMATEIPIANIHDVETNYKEIFVKWNTESTGNTISATEISAEGCFDDIVNTKYVQIDVIATSFDISIAWDQNTTDSKPAADCAIVAGTGATPDYLNTIAFVVTKTDGAFGTNDPNQVWNFTYEYSIDGGVTWITDANTAANAKGEVDSQEEKVVVAKANGETTITFKREILASNTVGDYVFMVRITDARDGYNTPALKAKTLVATATYHRLPEAATITLD